MNAVTQSERLTRIETLLETAVLQRAEDRDDMRKTIENMAADIRAIKADLEQDKAALAELKNKGSGLLIGVGLAGGALGASVSSIVEWFK